MCVLWKDISSPYTCSQNEYAEKNFLLYFFPSEFSFNFKFQHLLVDDDFTVWWQTHIHIFTFSRCNVSLKYNHHKTYIHTHAHTLLKRWEWQVESNVALEVLAQHFDASWMEFKTMPHSGEKNSLHHATVAQEIMKIFSISLDWVKNTLHCWTISAQKVREFSRICQRAWLSRYFMMYRTRKIQIKQAIAAMVLDFSSFCAFETGIWSAQVKMEISSTAIALW